MATPWSSMPAMLKWQGEELRRLVKAQRTQACICLVLIVLAWLCPSPLQAAPTTDAITDFDITRVYDGDTFFINLPVETCQHDVLCRDLGVRVIGVDTPEIRGGQCPEEKAAAYRARNFVRTLLQAASSVSLLEVKRDRNFRIDAIVVLDGKQNLASLIIAAGHGVFYSGKHARAQDWCEGRVL